MRTLRRAHPGWFELAVFALAYATYFGVRALTEGKVSDAVGNAIELVHVERKLDLNWEDAVQGLVLGEHALVDAVNAIYIWGHWPVLIVGGFLLFHLGQARVPPPAHRDPALRRARARDLRPLPGRAAAARPGRPAQDTVTLHSEAYRTVLPPSLINEYAAMPSFHAGWNLLLGIELFRVSRNVLLRAFALLMPVAMAFSVVATANHYILDVVGGAAVVITALLLVSWRENSEPNRD